MKQIFDWLREQMQIKSDIIHHNWEETNDEKQFKCHTAYDDTIRMVDEAEAKWEADCCEWNRLARGNAVWRTSCGKQRTELIYGDETHCQFCGKPIKISEVE